MGMRERLRSCSETVLGFFYPEVCQSCFEEWAGAATGFICSKCESTVRFIEPPFCDRCGLPFHGEIFAPFECANCREMELHFEFSRAAVAADGLVLDLIHRWKYNQALWVEPFLAGLMITCARQAIHEGPWNLIVPVPLHPLKEREREFNQADHLAWRLSLATGVPISRSALRRVVPTRTQTRLCRSERTSNMRNAFVSDSSETVQGRNVVLVDDVLTTGATTSACARVLKAAGAERVCVWTLARGLLH